jgi:hypothetical protein
LLKCNTITIRAVCETDTFVCLQHSLIRLHCNEIPAYIDLIPLLPHRMQLTACWCRPIPFQSCEQSCRVAQLTASLPSPPKSQARRLPSYQQIHHGREFAPHGARNLSIMVTSLLLVAQGIFSPSWSRVCSSRRKESFPASVASSMMRLPSHGNNRGASRIQGEATDAVVPQTGRRSPPD